MFKISSKKTETVTIYINTMCKLEPPLCDDSPKWQIHHDQRSHQTRTDGDW